MTWTVGFKLERPLLHVLLHFIQQVEKGMKKNICFFSENFRMGLSVCFLNKRKAVRRPKLRFSGQSMAPRSGTFPEHLPCRLPGPDRRPSLHLSPGGQAIRGDPAPPASSSTASGLGSALANAKLLDQNPPPEGCVFLNTKFGGLGRIYQKQLLTNSII